MARFIHAHDVFAQPFARSFIRGFARSALKSAKKDAREHFAVRGTVFEPLVADKHFFSLGRLEAWAEGGLREASPGIDKLLSMRDYVTETIDEKTGVEGMSKFLFKLTKLAIRLEWHAHQREKWSLDELLSLMRSRVPVDSGRLLNGISGEQHEGFAIVSASAVHDDGGADYARFVEEGTKFAAAQPFFYNSIEEVLSRHGVTMEAAIAAAAHDAELD